MWIGVLWAGLRVAMWITHVGGKFRHGLLEKSLTHAVASLKIVKRRWATDPGPRNDIFGDSKMTFQSPGTVTQECLQKLLSSG